MTHQAAEVLAHVIEGKTLKEALIGSPCVEIGDFDGIRSWWMEDGSRIWRSTGYDTTLHCCPPSDGPREKNRKPFVA